MKTKTIILFLAIVAFSSCRKKADCYLVDSNLTEVNVEGIPKSKLSGDTINVIQTKFTEEGYPYCYVDGDGTHKAVIK